MAALELPVPHLVRRESLKLQSKKISELADALIVAGYRRLDAQASALGLSRSTTWTILHGKHKKSGLSASVINQMLAQPRLSALVRRKLLEYVEQKSCGMYGHKERGLSRFVFGLSGFGPDIDDCRGHSLHAGSVPWDSGASSTAAGPAIRAWLAGRLPQQLGASRDDICKTAKIPQNLFGGE